MSKAASDTSTHSSDLQLWPVAIRMAFRIARRWRLTQAEFGVLLGGVSPSTLRTWRKQSLKRRSVSARQAIALERIFYLLRIHRALNVLFVDSNQSSGWLRRPNRGAGFNGRSGMERLLTGQMDELRAVHDYLLAACQ